MTTEIAAPPNPADSGDELALSRAELRREHASLLVTSLYRLVKVCRIHVESNQAVRDVMEAALAAAQAYHERTGDPAVSLLFTTDTIFVNGDMLRIARDAYGMAMEFGGWLERLRLSELTFTRDVNLLSMASFVHHFMLALRDATQVETLHRADIPGVRVRQLAVQSGRDGPLLEAPEERLLRTYAAATVIVRQSYEKLRTGTTKLPAAVKRVAQRLVATAEESPQALVALAATRTPATDPAMGTVSRAVLALVIARQLTADRVLLSGLVVSAFLSEAGDVRLRSLLAADVAHAAGAPRELTERDDLRVPASTAVMMTALGRIHAPAMQRAVVAFESLWAERAAKLGALYGGRRPATVLGRILAVSRRFHAYLSGAATGTPLSIDEVLQHMSAGALDENERTDVRLLIGALGIFPAGTIVELSTGELGVVLATPEHPIDFARPPVRILYDERGQKLAEPFDVDLTAPSPLRLVKRAVESDEQQMKAMRAYVMTVAASRKGAAKPAKSAPQDLAASLPDRTPNARKPVEPPPSTTPDGHTPSLSIGRVKVTKLAVARSQGAVEETVAPRTEAATQFVDWAEYNPVITSPANRPSATEPEEPPPSRGEAWADGLEVVGLADEEIAEAPFSSPAPPAPASSKAVASKPAPSAPASRAVVSRPAPSAPASSKVAPTRPSASSPSSPSTPGAPTSTRANEAPATRVVSWSAPPDGVATLAVDWADEELDNATRALEWAELSEARDRSRAPTPPQALAPASTSQTTTAEPNEPAPTSVRPSSRWARTAALLREFDDGGAEATDEPKK